MTDINKQPNVFIGEYAGIGSTAFTQQGGLNNFNFAIPLTTTNAVYRKASELIN